MVMPIRTSRGLQSLLETLSDQFVVRPNQSPRGNRNRHCHLVSWRPSSDPDPLASGSRSFRRTRPAGIPCNRSQRQTARHPRLVRQPMAGRSHIRGSACPSRRRDPAPMVRQGHSAHDAGSAGNVLSRHSVDARSRKITSTQAKDRRVVSKIRSHLQRRHRGSSPRNMASSNFLHVPAAPRQHRNSAAHLAPRRKRARLRRLNRPKSS